MNCGILVLKMAIKVSIRGIPGLDGVQTKNVCVKSYGIWFPIVYPFGFKDTSRGMMYSGFGVIRFIYEGTKPYQKALKLFKVLQNL